MAHTSIKTKIEDIVSYWFSRVDECDLSVDAAEAHERCWRCGCERNLERCHIVPDSLGGKDEPSNLVLLCKRCHAENPNVDDPDIMWDWLKAYKVAFYDTFWSSRGQLEYKFIYKKSIIEELKSIGITTPQEVEKELQNVIAEVQKKASVHFGQPYFNTATVAGIYRIVLKELAKKRKVSLSAPEKNKRTAPWWIDALQ